MPYTKDGKWLGNDAFNEYGTAEDEKNLIEVTINGRKYISSRFGPQYGSPDSLGGQMMNQYVIPDPMYASTGRGTGYLVPYDKVQEMHAAEPSMFNDPLSLLPLGALAGLVAGPIATSMGAYGGAAASAATQGGAGGAGTNVLDPSSWMDKTLAQNFGNTMMDSPIMADTEPFIQGMTPQGGGMEFDWSQWPGGESSKTMMDAGEFGGTINNSTPNLYDLPQSLTGMDPATAAQYAGGGAMSSTGPLGNFTTTPGGTNYNLGSGTNMTGAGAGSSATGSWWRQFGDMLGIPSGVQDVLGKGADALTSRNGMGLLNGLLEYQNANQNRDMLRDMNNQAMERADPFASQRPYYQNLLRQSYEDPNFLANNATFGGLRDLAVNDSRRIAAGQGYNNSSNLFHDIADRVQKQGANYLGQFQGQVAQNAGAGISPATGAMLQAQGAQQVTNANNQRSGALGDVLTSGANILKGFGLA